MDAFFAAVEQRDDPALRGRPVAVQRPVRCADVRRSLSPSLGHGFATLPDLVFVPLRFDVYEAVSRQVHAIFAEFTELIQPLSLDEAYLDVTENRAGLPSA